MAKLLPGPESSSSANGEDGAPFVESNALEVLKKPYVSSSPIVKKLASPLFSKLTEYLFVCFVLKEKLALFSALIVPSAPDDTVQDCPGGSIYRVVLPVVELE